MTLAISVKNRMGSDNDAIRAAGQVPAVVYGPEMEATSVQVESMAFEKLYSEAGDSSIVEVTLEDGKTVPCLIKDFQLHPTKDQVIHIDFMQVNMNVEIETSIALEFVGESLAVKQGGTLVTAMETLDVTCLPKDLVASIEVDITKLATFDDMIVVSDIKLPAGMVTSAEGDAVVATVSAPLTEEEIKAMEEENSVSIEDIEVEEKGKKEEDSEESEDKE